MGFSVLTTLDYIQRRRVFFPFVTPNTLGGYLAMIIPLIFAFWSKKNLSFLISVSSALLLTRSLGAFLSLFLGLVIYSYLRGQKRILFFLLGLLIITGLLFIIRTTEQKQHFQPFFLQ